ncbi:MAG: LysM peptidoglycan-binding domain-containing protein [Acidobacteria bacterium]|nr:LysM peptidoglycan-binding domain-containing protein [Acidobacteriota bacterium]
MVRVRCVVSILLIVAAAPLAYANESSRPPTNLHKVGDHWTPYNPPDPSTFPAGAKVHTIEKGDTLWDLANKFYGNPYLWPQLWEQNTYITDAHWIYPGDPLLVQGETAADATAVGEGEFAMTPQGGEDGDLTASVSETAGPAPRPLGKESDIYCFGYLATEDENLPNTIRMFEDVETRFVEGSKEQLGSMTNGDMLYIDGGTATGLAAGETYLVVMPWPSVVYHPVTGERVGRHYDFRGQVKILCASEYEATAIVVQSCKDIHIGDKLKPLPQIPIPIVRDPDMPTLCDPPSEKAQGHIVNAKDFAFALGEGAVVEINLGRDDMVEPGTFLTIYRDNPHGGPRILLGELGVLTAEAKTATAMITQMRYSMQIGDRVEVTR